MQEELAVKRIFSPNGFIYQMHMARVSILAIDLTVHIYGPLSVHFRSTFGREIIKWKFFNRDKTFEDIEDRLHELDEDENLTQQQKNFICFFIFPNCASKQKQMIHIGMGYSIP